MYSSTPHSVINREAAESWTRGDVIERWRRLFAGPPLVKRYCEGHCLSKAEFEAVDAVVAEWRRRLMDISWFMRYLNEFTARKNFHTEPAL